MIQLKRKYGVATTIRVPLFDRLTGELLASLSFVAADSKISKGGAGFANCSDTIAAATCANGFYEITLTTTEMESDQIIIMLEDQDSPKLYSDTVILIDTYGHASAQYAFDFDINSPALMEADLFVDITTTPWELQWRAKGTATELMVKRLYDTAGANLVAATTPVGRQTHTT